MSKARNVLSVWLGVLMLLSVVPAKGADMPAAAGSRAILYAPAPFEDGDHIGVWGDSITFTSRFREPDPPTETYVTNLTQFYAVKYPDKQITFSTFGYPGDSTKDLLFRIGRDFESIQEPLPQINKAILLIGTNDPTVTKPDESYKMKERLGEIVEILRSKGLSYKDIIICAPTAFDQVRANAIPDDDPLDPKGAYKATVNAAAPLVEIYGELAIELANELGCPAVDLWKEMQDYEKLLKYGQPLSPSMPGLTIPINPNDRKYDNLHPNDLGHFVMARAILKAQGLLDMGGPSPHVIGDAAKVTVDVKNSTITGSNYSTGAIALASSNETRFSYKPDTMPFKNHRGYTAMRDWADIDAEMKNLDTLKVSGLEEGYYNVKILENGTQGVESRYLSSKELAGGISVLHSDDIYRQLSDIHYWNNTLMYEILQPESYFLGFTEPVSKEVGIAAANAKPVDAHWTANVKRVYMDSKAKEDTYRSNLAASWEKLRDLLANRTLNIEIKKVNPEDKFVQNDDRAGIQGKNDWRYQYVRLKNNGEFSNVYEDMRYWDTGNNRAWYKDKDEAKVYFGGSYGRLYMQDNAASRDTYHSPGNMGDVAITFVAPASGTIKIQTTTDKSVVNNKIEESYGDKGADADIIRFRVFQNDTLLYPTGANDSEGYPNFSPPGVSSQFDPLNGKFPMQYKDWMVLRRVVKDNTLATANRMNVDFAPIYRTVEAGDRIIFRVNKGSNAPGNTLDQDGYTYGNAADRLNFMPVITYTEVTAPAPAYQLSMPEVTQLSDSLLRIRASVYDTYPASAGNKVSFIIVKYQDGRMVDTRLFQKSPSDCALQLNEFVSLEDCDQVKVFTWKDLDTLAPHPEYTQVYEWTKP